MRSENVWLTNTDVTGNQHFNKMMQREISGTYIIGTMIKASSFKKFGYEKEQRNLELSREEGGSNRSFVSNSNNSKCSYSTFFVPGMLLTTLFLTTSNYYK